MNTPNDDTQQVAAVAAATSTLQRSNSAMELPEQPSETSTLPIQSSLYPIVPSSGPKLQPPETMVVAAAAAATSTLPIQSRLYPSIPTLPAPVLPLEKNNASLPPQSVGFAPYFIRYQGLEQPQGQQPPQQVGFVPYFIRHQGLEQPQGQQPPQQVGFVPYFIRHQGLEQPQGHGLFRYPKIGNYANGLPINPLQKYDYIKSQESTVTVTPASAANANEMAPGMPVGMAPGMPVGMAPGTAVGAVPGTAIGAAPGMPVGMAPGTAVGAVPGMPVGAVPGMPVGAAPGMAVGIPSGMPGAGAVPPPLVSDETRLKYDIRSTLSNFNNIDDQSQKNQVILNLDIFQTFVAYMEKKQAKWINDIANTNELMAKIATASSQMKSVPERSTEWEKYSDQIVYHVERMGRLYGSKSKDNFMTMKKFFVKTDRRNIRAILQFIKEKNGQAPDIETKFNELNQRLMTSTDKFFQQLDLLSQNVRGKYAEIDEEKAARLNNMIEKTYEQIRTHQDKINSFYELRYSLLEMTLDTQFYIIYVIKVIRMFFAYIALFLATRMFVPIYEETVYDSKKDPPPLWKYMLIFMGFDISLNIFLIVLLYLVKYLFKSEDNTFIIDGGMIMNQIYDYGISLAVTMAIGVLIGRVIVKKKYFKYKYEGMRAIRAFEKMIFYVALVNNVVPYFLMF